MIGMLLKPLFLFHFCTGDVDDNGDAMALCNTILDRQSTEHQRQTTDNQAQYQHLFLRYEDCSKDKNDAVTRVRMLETLIVTGYEEKLAQLR